MTLSVVCAYNTYLETISELFLDLLVLCGVKNSVFGQVIISTVVLRT